MQTRIAKCLSVQQPWAWMLLYGGKTVENRNWPTSYRGPLLIQCGKREDREASEDYRDPQWELAGKHLNMEADEAWWTYNHDRTHGRGSLGKAIGWVKVDGCYRPGSIPDEGFDWRDPMQYGWILKDATPAPLPFDLKGRLGLWDVQLPEGVKCPYDLSKL